MRTLTKVILSVIFLLLLLPVLFLLSFYIPAGEPYGAQRSLPGVNSLLDFPLLADGEVQLSEADLTLLANSRLSAVNTALPSQSAAVSRLEVRLPGNDAAVTVYVSAKRLFGFLTFPTAFEIKGTPIYTDGTLTFTVNSIKLGRLISLKPATILKLLARFGVQPPGTPPTEMMKEGKLSFTADVEDLLGNTKKLLIIKGIAVSNHSLRITLEANSEGIRKLKSEVKAVAQKLEQKALSRMAEEASSPEEKMFVEKAQAVVTALNDGELEEIRAADVLEISNLYNNLPADRQVKLQEIVKSSLTDMEAERLESMLKDYTVK